MFSNSTSRPSTHKRKQSDLLMRYSGIHTNYDGWMKIWIDADSRFRNQDLVRKTWGTWHTTGGDKASAPEQTLGNLCIPTQKSLEEITAGDTHIGKTFSIQRPIDLSGWEKLHSSMSLTVHSGAKILCDLHALNRFSDTHCPLFYEITRTQSLGADAIVSHNVRRWCKLVTTWRLTQLPLPDWKWWCLTHAILWPNSTHPNACRDFQTNRIHQVAASDRNDTTNCQLGPFCRFFNQKIFWRQAFIQKLSARHRLLYQRACMTSQCIC